MKPILLLAIFLLNVQNLYPQRIIYSDSIPKQTLRIVPNHIYGGLVSQNLSEIEYFELESDKDNLVGSIISRLFTKNRILLIDSPNGNLYIFNRNGKLLKKINAIEGFKKPNKILFYRVQLENEKFVAYGPNIRIVYDENGNEIEKEINYNFSYKNSTLLMDSTLYEYGDPQAYMEKSNNDFALKMNNNILIKYNSEDTIDTFLEQGIPIVSNSNKSAYVVYPTTYNIFELNSKGITKNIKIIFPLINTIDTSEFYIYKNPSILKDYLNKFPDKIFGIGSPILYGNYLIVKLKNFKYPDWIAINLENYKVLSLNKILPDKSNDFLPFIDLSYLNTDGEYLYSIIYPIDVFKAIDEGQKEGHKMRKEYMNLQKSKNPIVVRFKLK